MTKKASFQCPRLAGAQHSRSVCKIATTTSPTTSCQAEVSILATPCNTNTHILYLPVPAQHKCFLSSQIWLTQHGPCPPVWRTLPTRIAVVRTHYPTTKCQAQCRRSLLGILGISQRRPCSTQGPTTMMLTPRTCTCLATRSSVPSSLFRQQTRYSLTMGSLISTTKTDWKIPQVQPRRTTNIRTSHAWSGLETLAMDILFVTSAYFCPRSCFTCHRCCSMSTIQRASLLWSLYWSCRFLYTFRFFAHDWVPKVMGLMNLDGLIFLLFFAPVIGAETPSR